MGFGFFLNVDMIINYFQWCHTKDQMNYSSMK